MKYLKSIGCDPLQGSLLLPSQLWPLSWGELIVILQCLWVKEWPEIGRVAGPFPAADLISTSSQVVAVVMDMFTDVDLLSEVLEAAARRVPVYILLDELNAQHFLDMADKCRVNLHHVDVSDQARGVEGKIPLRKT